MKLSVVEPLSELDGYFVYVSTPVIDILAGLLAVMSNRRVYTSDADYERGYNQVALIKRCMLICPAERLVLTHEALYRLVDWGFNGTVYSITSEEPLVIEPAIPHVPVMTPQLPGNLAQLELANVTLEEIRDALIEAGEDPESVLSVLQIIAGLVA